MYKDIKVLLLNKTHQLFILFILILLIMIFEMIGLGLIPIYALLITDTNALDLDNENKILVDVTNSYKLAKK
mgnify:CR=1 FL=1